MKASSTTIYSRKSTRLSNYIFLKVLVTNLQTNMTIEEKGTVRNFTTIYYTTCRQTSQLYTNGSQLDYIMNCHGRIQTIDSEILDLFTDTIGRHSLNKVQLSIDLSKDNQAFSDTKSKTLKHIKFNEASAFIIIRLQTCNKHLHRR